MNRAPQLPTLVRGQRIRNGPFSVIVTEEMVRERERQNEELSRRWEREEQRRRHLAEGTDDYFGEFAELKVRRRFIRRVFSILTVQITFTALVIASFIFVPQVQDFALQRPVLMWIATAAFIVTYLVISCSECGRQGACGVISLIILTLSMAYLTAGLSIIYSVQAVLIAAVGTAVVTFVITCIATCTNFDLTKYLGLMTIIALVALLAMIILLLMWYLGYGDISTLQLAIGIIGALMLSMYLFFDVQTIMGGRSIALEPDEIIYATTQLYVDIILLYRYILLIAGFVDQ